VSGVSAALLPQRPTVGVQAAVFRGSDVLLQQRANVFGAGTWGLPGGHLEFGESFEAAASRELAEECGLQAVDLRTVCSHNTPYERTHYVQIAVEVLNWRGEPEIREPDRCSGLRFFPLSHLPQPLFEPSVHILDYLRGRSYADAAQHRLSLSFTRADDHDASVHRLHYLLLLGQYGLGVQRSFTGDRRKAKRERVTRFSNPDQAWEWLRRQLARRLDEGFELGNCQGDAPLDRVMGCFPSSHPVGLQRLTEQVDPAINPHQLALLPEHSGW
jgi:8-oxo-dGTP diphosphatase